jgi:hypothetical protein
MEDASSYDDTAQVVDEGLHGWHLENIESLLGVMGVGVGVAVDVGVAVGVRGRGGGRGVGVGTAMTDAYFL